ncbi:unnamed protein product [Cuscuta epithymum]|uniref:Arabidopsis retrotransposon Orf1 C-terminal domain-containing protein n=2 Tax=Cuscuta epithymum TaxID=186058 RepID=A0AAV0GJ65_9ASTE|nr:unnamed protein product [Cuscuta epithymum]
MAPKRNQPEGSNSRGPIRGYEDVQFGPGDHRKRFVTALKRQVIPSRFLCHDALTSLGLLNGMRELFDELHMGLIFNLQYNCNERIIYEFLSSAKFALDENHFYDDTITFRLMNTEYTITRRDFAEHFGLRFPHEREIPDNTMDAYNLWGKITGERNFSTSQLYISHVQHPLLRIFLKFLCNSLLGRPNNHHTRIGDVAILTLALFRNPVEFNICNLIWDHLQKAITKGGNIVVGGVIMHLASKFGYVDNATISRDSLMHLGWLSNAQLISLGNKDHNGNQKYKWHMKYPEPVKYFPLPCDELPRLRYKMEPAHIPHYLLPNNIPPHLQAQADQADQAEQPNPQPEQPAHQEDYGHFQHDIPDPPQNPPPQDFFQQLLEGQQSLLAGFQTMSLDYTKMGEQFTQLQGEIGHYRNEQQARDRQFDAYREEQRLAFQRMEEQRAADMQRYEEDYRRMYGPTYSYMSQLGGFASMASPPPAPSWYNPSDWGNFGGSSSGGGGYDGGDTTMGEGGGDDMHGSGFGGGYYGGEGGH